MPIQLHPSITIDRITKACEEDDNLGFCTACGEDADCVEPDARRYECDFCGKEAVFGAEELLLITNNSRIDS